MNVLGKIVKTRGNKGEVLLRTSPAITALAGYIDINQSVILKLRDIKKELKIEKITPFKGQFIIKFKSYDSINSSYKLVGYSILSNMTDTIEQSDSVLGYTVVEYDSGIVWGRVTDLIQMGLNVLLQVDDERGGEVLIPHTPDIVLEINKKDKTLMISPPEGLRDLN